KPGLVMVTSAPEAHSVAGGGLVTVKLIALEVRLVGAGFVTVTGNEPTTARSAAVIATVNLVALTKVVVLLTPFHFTTAPVTKPAPVTVSVKAGSPATAVNGVKPVRTGMPVMLTAFDVRIDDAV